MKEKIWFLSPSVNVPTGGINNFYRLCKIAEELGIEAHVISVNPYTYTDPSDLSKYWVKSEDIGFRYDQFNIPQIQEGDIVVHPEIYCWRSTFSKPVRRVTYAQNWAILTENSWENHYWVYNNMTFLTYCFESVSKRDYLYRDRMTGLNMELDDTSNFINHKKLKWSTVSPYFEKEDFERKDNRDIDIVMFPRKSPKIVDLFKEKFGDRLLVVDGVTPDEVKNILSKTKVVVLPSAAEGLCFPAIESMLSGAVVVTWPCGAPEDYIINDYTGMLCKYNNIDELLEKTKYLLDNPDKLKYISDTAYEFITKLYTKEEAKKELLISYHSSLLINPE